MKIVQGFINIAALVKNQPGVNSTIGELSTYSKTYSKEKGFYESLDYPGYQLITFSSFNQDTGNALSLEQNFVEEILNVAKHVYRYATTRSRPYDNLDYFRTLQQELKLIAANFVMGELVEGDSISLPSFVSWSSIYHDNSEVTIWFSDEHFADQYTGYEITVIPPFTNLDDFFKPYDKVILDIDNISMREFGERMQESKVRHPETVVRLMEFDFVNHHDPDRKKKTTWGILVYGKEGDHDDAIKDAIVDWLSKNSSQDIERWEIIFPEIFKRTEMVIVPRWDQIAVENFSDRSSLYSSLVNIGEAYQFVQDFINFYSKDHVKNKTYIFPYTYKTILCTVTNGIKNSKGKEDFKKTYFDYLPIPSTSFDFSRMHLRTQNMALFLDDLFLQAEKATPTTPLKTPLRRVMRNGIFFVSAVHDGISFLVAAKFNPVFRTQ